MINSRIQFITDQNKMTRNQTIELLDNTPIELWYETPEIIKSNIAWQVGHLIVSQFYHSIAVIRKPDLQIYIDIPLKEYIPIYSMFTKSTINELQPSPEILLSQLHKMNEYARQSIGSLSENELNDKLEPTKFPHPIAKTKYEALTWSFRHEMWHLGQIATLKRVLKNPFEWYKHEDEKGIK